MIKWLFKKYSAKELEEEVYGTVEDYEDVIEEPKERVKSKGSKKVPLEINGKSYNSIREAEKDLDGNIKWAMNNQVKHISQHFKIKFK